MKNFKFVFFTVIILLCTLLMFRNNNISANDNVDRTNWSNEEIISFLSNNDISCPFDCSDEEICDFVRFLIYNVNENYDYKYICNYTVTYSFANDIIETYKNNHRMNYNNNGQSIRNNDHLIYSNVLDNGNWQDYGGDWKQKWSNYNCYAYAIHRSESEKFYSRDHQYNPGFTSNSYIYTLDSEELSEIVNDDLVALGYTVNYVGTTMPSTINDNQELICVRTTIGSFPSNLFNWDYHFMRYDKYDEVWYHKPGDTAVLRYNTSVSNSLLWYDEYSLNGVCNSNYMHKYCDTIYYILYTMPTILIDDSMINLISENKYCYSSSDIMYKVFIDDDGYYSFSINASYPFEMHFYNDDMDTISTLESISNEVYLSRYLDEGVYFLRLNYDSNLDSGLFNIAVGNINNNLIISSNVNTNNIINKVNENNSGISNVFMFHNDVCAIYSISLIAVLQNNANYSLQANSITIYDSVSCVNPVKKYDYNGVQLQATNKSGENHFCFSSNSMETYYIKIDVDLYIEDLLYLYLDITPLTNIDADLFDLLANYSDYICNDEYYTKGDIFKRLDIEQSCKLNINLSSDELNPVNTLFVFCKLDFDVTYNIFVFTDLIVEEISEMNNQYYSSVITLDVGTYYFGLFNISDNRGIYLEIIRQLTISGSNYLISDPSSSYVCGSHINFLEKYSNTKSYQSNYISIGFTRFIYVICNLGVSNNGLDYYWYSSNDEVASVDENGRIFAKSTGSTKIMAVLKNNPSVAFVKEFTINQAVNIPDVYESIDIAFSTTNDGTFVLNLGNVNCPYPDYSLYSFDIIAQSNNIYPSIDGDCCFTVNGLGWFQVLIDSYYYDSNVRLFLTINII